MISSNHARLIWRIVAGISLVVLLGGCGEDGPMRYDLSGSVTYEGQPVPQGYMVFSPDTDAGNQGVGATANIKDGHFATPPGLGIVGGPHVVSISGFDGQPYQDGPISVPVGKPLFVDLQVKVDLAKSTATHDFQLPVEGAN